MRDVTRTASRGGDVKGGGGGGEGEGRRGERIKGKEGVKEEKKRRGKG